MIFESGPAKETRNSPSLGFLKLYGLTGTGFAHPNMIPPGKSAHIIGTTTEPIGSMCFIGFNVSLPAYLAVGSPCQRAAIP